MTGRVASQAGPSRGYVTIIWGFCFLKDRSGEYSRVSCVPWCYLVSRNTHFSQYFLIVVQTPEVSTRRVVAGYWLAYYFRCPVLLSIFSSVLHMVVDERVSTRTGSRTSWQCLRLSVLPCDSDVFSAAICSPFQWVTVAMSDVFLATFCIFSRWSSFKKPNFGSVSCSRQKAEFRVCELLQELSLLSYTLRYVSLEDR